MHNDLLPPLVRPAGQHRVGDTIRVTWAFTNFKPQTLNGTKLRLDVPSAVVINAQQSSIGGTRRDEISLEAFTHSGEPISLGSVTSGESLWLDLFMTAHGPTPIEGLPFSVDLCWDDQAWLQGKAAPIFVRAFPDVSVLDPQIVTQKSEEHRFGIVFAFANRGATAAQNLSFRVPAPLGFLISRIGGEGVADHGDAVNREVTIASLPPNQELSIAVEFVAGPEASDAVEVDNAVLSYDGGEALVPAVALRLSSHVDFSESSLALDGDSAAVRAGSIVRVVLSVVNRGRSNAKDVRVGFRLPHELLYADGTIAINGGVDARRNDLHELTLPLVRGNSATTVAFQAVVRSPIAPNTLVRVCAIVDDVEVAPLDFEVDSQPGFPTSENYVMSSDPTTVAAGATRRVCVRVHNAGTATADGVRLRVDTNGLTIDKAVIVDADGRETTAALGPVSGDIDSNIIDLGSVEPRTTRMVGLTMAAPDAFENGAVFAVRAYVRTTHEPELPIGGLDLRGRSRPVITAEQSEIRALRDDAIRAGQHRIVTVRLENTGSAKAELVSVDLDLPATLIATHAEGAELHSGKLLFARILPRTLAAATVRIESVASHDGGCVDVRPLVSGPGITAFRMRPLTLLTAGRVVFEGVRAEIRAVAGTDRVSVALGFTNAGDRAARNIVIALPNVPAGYVAGSTWILEGANSMPIPDLQGSTLLAHGLLIPMMDPSVHVTVALDVVVGANDDLAAGFTIDCDSLPRITAEAKPFRRARQRRIGVDRTPELIMEGPRMVGQSPTSTDVIAALAGATTPPATELRVTGDRVETALQCAPSVDHGADGSADENATPAAAITHDEEASPATTAPVERTASPEEAEERSESATADEAVPNVRMRAAESLEGVHFDAPVGRRVMDSRYAEKVGRFLDLLDSQPDLGMYKHLFAMRLFLPHWVDGVSPDVATALGQTILPVAVQGQLRAIAILVTPEFQPTEAWAARFEDRATESAAMALLQIADRLSRNDVSVVVPPGTGEVFGLISATYRDEYRHAAQLGGGHFHRMLAELMPTESIDYPELANALAHYRAGLIEALDAFVYQTPTPRHESLTRTTNDRLDRSLDEIGRVVATLSHHMQVA